MTDWSGFYVALAIIFAGYLVGHGLGDIRIVVNNTTQAERVSVFARPEQVVDVRFHRQVTKPSE